MITIPYIFRSGLNIILRNTAIDSVFIIPYSSGQNDVFSCSMNINKPNLYLVQNILQPRAEPHSLTQLNSNPNLNSDSAEEDDPKFFKRMGKLLEIVISEYL